MLFNTRSITPFISHRQVQGWINDPPVTVEPFQFSPAEPVAYEWSYGWHVRHNPMPLKNDRYSY
jgi:hypothetical protein